ncbi:MAG: MATE family efflux transporter [Candidatus Magasanikbacteria bacterium]
MTAEHNIKDLTVGNIPKHLWSLAWPMMLSMFFYTLYSIVDTFWVSKLSTEAIAAVSISQITLFVMIALSMGIAVGSGVFMAMSIGAKNKPEAERILGQSFVLAAISGVFFTIISLLFKHQLLTVSGATGLIYEPALEYFTVTAGGSILFFFLMNVMFAFNSEGDTFTLTKLFAVSTLVNVVLDPIMIFGKFGMPALGISGAAYATLISQVVFLVLGIIVLSGKKRNIRFSFHNLSFNFASVKQILKIGIPASLTQVINPIGLAALIFITSQIFLEAGAIAFSLVFRVEFFAFLPAAGFGFAAMAMIGQSMGAGKLERAQAVFKKAIVLGFLSASGFGVLAILFGGYIVGIFTTDPQVMKYSLMYLWIVGGTYGFLAAAMIEASVFQAMGRSWPGFWIFFTKFMFISLPLGYVLTSVFKFDIWAMWTAIALSNVVVAVFGYLWSRRTVETKKTMEVLM